MKYFAYGSNMLLTRLRERVPSAKVMSIGILFEHRLQFHKVSHDGSGKCDAFQTDKDYDYIHGVIFDIPKKEKNELDMAEGLGVGYEEKMVDIFVESDKTIVTAFTYYATDIDDNLSPYHWYKDFVLQGAIENRLPEEYIDLIRKTSSLDDPDTKREALNKNILSKQNT